MNRPERVGLWRSGVSRTRLGCLVLRRARQTIQRKTQIMIMTLEQSKKLIKGCADQMNSRYHGVVFDEWAVVSLTDKKSRILNYMGPRNDDFLKNFVSDLGTLRTKLLNPDHVAGDFEFSRHGVGTMHEAFMVVADGVYLICNNTRNTMDGITKDARWLEAQVPFVELSEKFRSNPLVFKW